MRQFILLVSVLSFLVLPLPTGTYAQGAKKPPTPQTYPERPCPSC